MDIAIKIENVSKEYQLGAIGGTTLREEIARWVDKLLGRPSTLPSGRFMALENINLTVKKGERLGIIGHNGAGKSTMLKLLSRVTAPTTGSISYNGRISSMLEVGTGFHAELTGRENIYMNGAILGMTKKEIDSKLAEIIEFSEIGEFIDTPVKRYSSGMYVKLAFSVAAHLDNEILIMDEVLAVGDMRFQEKCLNKMDAVSKKGGKTILYVSHNMNTIRQLCDRCIVLDHGHVVFDGDVEGAIGCYMGIHNTAGGIIDLSGMEREKPFADGPSRMELLVLKNETGVYEMDSVLQGTLTVSSTIDVERIILSAYLLHQGVAVSCMRSEPVIELRKDSKVEVPFEVDLAHIAPGRYVLKLALTIMNGTGFAQYYDALSNCYAFEIAQKDGFNYNQRWNFKYHGYLTGAAVRILPK